MITILKFFKNTNKKSNKDDDDNEEDNKSSNDNEIISRTLCKIAVVSRHYSQQPGVIMPKQGEIWRCKIVKEISSGLNKGCFVVEPIEKLEETSILHLLPGFFCKKVVKGRLIVYPKKPGLDWILPLTHKNIMAEEYGAYCVIVQLDASPEDLKECEKAAEIKE